MRFDLPRDPNNNAILGDGRNDENIIISQFHVAMLRFHNAVVDRLRADPANISQSAERIFKMAQRQVRWHYQWIILHEFLPLTIGQERVDDILKNGLRFYEVDKRNPLIPIEFSVSAYRFGHSQVRPSYRLNFGPSGGSPFFAFILTTPRTPTTQIRTICVAGSARLAGLLTGKHSSISAMEISGPTSGSTANSPLH